MTMKLVLVMTIDRDHSNWFLRLVLQFHLIVYLSLAGLSTHRLSSMEFPVLIFAFPSKRNDLMTMLLMMIFHDACQNAMISLTMNEIYANHCCCCYYSIYAYLFDFCWLCWT